MHVNLASSSCAARGSENLRVSQTATPPPDEHASSPSRSFRPGLQMPRRWSPRAMDGSALSREELLPLLEAARWAPTHKLTEPWRFVVIGPGRAKTEFEVGVCVCVRFV